MLGRTTRATLDAFLSQAAVRQMINANLLGMETSGALMARFVGLIIALDTACQAFFGVEIALKLYARGTRFFLDGWSVFDLAVVAMALVPTGQALSALRALRILRVLRVISVAPRLRRVVEGFTTALPGHDLRRGEPACRSHRQFDAGRAPF